MIRSVMAVCPDHFSRFFNFNRSICRHDRALWSIIRLYWSASPCWLEKYSRFFDYNGPTPPGSGDVKSKNRPGCRSRMPSPKTPPIARHSRLIPAHSGSLRHAPSTPASAGRPAVLPVPPARTEAQSRNATARRRQRSTAGCCPSSTRSSACGCRQSPWPGAPPDGCR
mgnify:CR=1 FL=1